MGIFDFFKNDDGFKGRKKYDFSIKKEYFTEESKLQATYSNQKGIKSEVTYRSNKRYGLYKYFHKNGQLKEEGNYTNDEKDGKFKEYYSNGQLKAEGNWKNDKEDGTIKHYHENGQLSLEEKWKNGKNIPPNKSYDEKGQLVSKKQTIKLFIFIPTTAPNNGDT